MVMKLAILFLGIPAGLHLQALQGEIGKAVF